MKTIVKTVFTALALMVTFPLALLAGFGRIRFLYETFSAAMALIPGLPGDYCRIAWYRLTLQLCSLNSRISFGSFFAQPSSEVARGVYIGSYCVIGSCQIGERTQIASMVQILSGARQHARDEHGRITGAEKGEFRRVTIGADCWIGASAIVMADVGAGTTIGAGAVVTKPIPPGVVAVGNPARVIRTLNSVQAGGGQD